MNGKRLFWYSMGLKLMIIFFVISLAWGHKLISQKWFDQAASEEAKINAVRYKEGNLNAHNEFGFTGPMIAAQQGDVALFKEFMWRGANITLESYDRPSINGKTVPQNMRKTTAIHIAVQAAEVHAKEEIEILKFLFDLLKQRNKEGRGNVDIMSLVNKKDAAGNTPLYYVLLPTILEDRAAILDLLLANGADFNARDFAGDTMLHQAVRRNDRPWVKYILSNERYKKLLKKDLKNKDGFTVKDLAKALNLRDMLAAICSFGIWPCEGDEFRGVDTPLG